MREPNRKQRRSAPVSQRNRTDRTRFWQTLFRWETRTPGLTKDFPDICGNYGGYGAKSKGGPRRLNIRQKREPSLTAVCQRRADWNVQRPTFNIQRSMAERRMREPGCKMTLPLFIEALDVGRWTLDVCLSPSPKTIPQTSAAPHSTAWWDCNSTVVLPSKYPRRSTARRPAARVTD
jgi:hypothetical protein